LNKPVILAGAGCLSCKEEFYDFINRVKAPVLLTWKAMGLLPDNHPLYCGRPGAVGQYAANRILQECDFLLVLGAKMDRDQTAYQLDKIAPKAKKYVVDVDETELQKYPDVWMKTNADLGLYFRTVIPEPSDCHEWLHYCRALNVNHPVCHPIWWQQKDVNYYCFLEELSNLASCEDVISPECSNTAPALYQSWRVKDGQEFTYAGALGAMGSGLPGAIGAALATDKRVLTVMGDGGFALNVQELEVIRRLNLPIKIFVIDNGGYSAIMNTQSAYFGRLVGCNEESGLTLPDIFDVSIAFGLPAVVIEENSQIKWTLETVLSCKDPIVVIVKVKPGFKTAHTVKKIIVNGVPTSGKFEDIE